MTALFERFRPQTWGEVVGQDKAVRVSQSLAAQGVGGRCVAYIGGPGSGKSSCAMILAREIADPVNIVEVDAQWLTPARISEIESTSTGYGLDYGRGAKTGRAYIVNEMHALSAASIRQLLTTLERIPSHVVWIFTTTRTGEGKLFDDCDDASPLLSRCLVVRMAERGIAEVGAEVVRRNMESVNMNGRPVEWYLRLFKECRNNWRMVYQRAESAALAGE